MEDPRQVGEGLVRTQVQAPAADFPPHSLARVAAGCREEVDELAARLVPGQSRAERVAEEIEALVLAAAASRRVLAVHDAGLALIEREPTVRQPRSDRGPQLPDLLLAAGVDDHVVAIALEQDARELPGLAAAPVLPVRSTVTLKVPAFSATE
jgi:hypothetical protein